MRGIALSYDRSVRKPPPAAPARPARPERTSPLPTHSPTVRVLCYCGVDFTFEDDAGNCPNCGQLAEWPTVGLLEREMRSDLEELLDAHEPGAEAD